jgi:hypothetical protein
MMVATRQNGAAPTALLRALLEGPMSRETVKARLGLDWRQTTNAARSLDKRGYLQLTAEGEYRLSDAGLVAAEAGEAVRSGPKGVVKIAPDTFRQRAWRAMRARGNFSIGDIVMDAGRDEDGGQPRDNAARYIKRLVQAGYVSEAARRQPGTAPSSNGFKRFTLRRNTGPMAPVFRSEVSAMHDPNTAEDVPCQSL